VWLDALVQQHHLTPWQVDLIQSDRAGEIRVADLILHSPDGRHSWRASKPGSRQEYLVRKVHAADNLSNENVIRQLESILDQVDQVRTTCPGIIALPERIVTTDQSPDVFVISEWPGGWSGAELLVRGGRLPCAAVAEMGRELLTGLVWLEHNRLLHGDVTVNHLRLKSNGSVVLTDAFVRQIEKPGLQLTPSMELQDLDGLAPELAGTGRVADIRCEFYAVGCLLWQLLTSRPVVLTADPVARLVKQKSHDIADPRNHVPDCPEWLARQIMTLTRRAPELRPATAEQALASWMENGPSGRANCRGLARKLPDRKRRALSTRRQTSRQGRRFRRVLGITLASTLLAATGLGIYTGQVPDVLRLPARQQSYSEPTRSASLPSNGELAERLSLLPDIARPLPAPDDAGVITLQAGGRYLATAIQQQTPLIIQGDSADDVAIIEVDPMTGWQIAAPGVTLQSVFVLPAANSDDAAQTGDRRPSQSVIKVVSNNLQIQSCRLSTPAHLGDAGIALQWRPVAEADSQVQFQDSVISGQGTAVWLQAAPSQLTLDNVLLATRSGAVRADYRHPGRHQLTAKLHRVTQRFGGSLFDLAVLRPDVASVELNVVCGECVFAPTSGLIRYVAPDGWSHEQLSVQFLLPDSGNPAVIDPESARMIYLDRRLGQLVEAPAERLKRDSLLYAVPIFADAETPLKGDAASELIDFEGPKLSRVMPGIVASRLPVLHQPD